LSSVGALRVTGRFWMPTDRASPSVNAFDAT
jgi:hypothetical protein